MSPPSRILTIKDMDSDSNTLLILLCCSVGLGSDFDGIGSTPRGLEDVSKYPDLVRNFSVFVLFCAASS